MHACVSYNILKNIMLHFAKTVQLYTVYTCRIIINFRDINLFLYINTWVKLLINRINMGIIHSWKLNIGVFISRRVSLKNDSNTYSYIYMVKLCS